MSWEGFKIGNANISVLLQPTSMSQKQHNYNAIYSSKNIININLLNKETLPFVLFLAR